MKHILWRVLSGSWNSFHNLTFTHKSFVKSYKKLKVKWKWMNLFPDVIWWFLIKFAALRMILTFGRFHTRTWWWWSWWWSWCYNDDDSWRWVLVRHEGQCAPECTVVYSVYSVYSVQWSVSVLRLSQSQLYSETSDTHCSILFQTNHSEAVTYWVTGHTISWGCLHSEQWPHQGSKYAVCKAELKHINYCQYCQDCSSVMCCIWSSISTADHHYCRIMTAGW